MVMRVEKIGEVLGVVLTPEAMAALNLREVEVEAVETGPAREHRYMTVEEGLAAFRRTAPRFRSTYTELAK